MRTSSDGQSEGFDAAAIILAFLNDETKSQLELPNLSAAQRKQMKSVVETHSQLTCESYGFGTERQMYVFKKASDASPHVSRDETNGSHNGSAEPAVLNPPPLQQQVDETQSRITENGGEVHLASIEERPCETLERDRGASPDRSSTTSSSSRAVGTQDLLTEPCQPGLSLPRGLSVRNTFIDVEDGQADNREVQSMPHGMFGHYLKAEMDERKNTETSKCLSPSPASDVAVLAPGTAVVIIGLQKLPAFNGSQGTVQSFDQESQRYNLLLATPASGQQWAKVKLENIQVLSPRALIPSFTPSSPALPR